MVARDHGLPERAKPIKASIVKPAAQEFARYVEFSLAPTAWYFTAVAPEGAIEPRTDTWTCMFALMKLVQSGQPAALSASAPGCIGASNYLGFNGVPAVAAALYLSGRERLKKDAALATAFYNGVKPIPARDKYIVFSRLDDIPDETVVQVVNLWIGAASLSVLHTLANFDRATNDNVIMPFSSGCQSIWTLPFQESLREEPRAVAGSLDPTVRSFIPKDVISFSMPASRFLEMRGNISGSFMEP